MNTRKDNEGRALARYRALPPALIQRPLRKLQRQSTASISRVTRYAANRGQGAYVRDVYHGTFS